MSLRAVVACALAVTAGACRDPSYTLVPTPVAVAVGAPLPVSARVLRVRVTKALERTQAALEPNARIAVELEVRNADPSRPATIGRLSLLVRDALGGPEVYAGQVDQDTSGLTPPSDLPRGAPQPPPPGPLVVGPGQTVVVWRVLAGFPPSGPSPPLRATVFVPVEGQPPLAVAIIDPVPGGPRWQGPSRSGSYLTVGFGALGTRGGFYDPIGSSWRGSSGRFIWGFDYRVSLRNRGVTGGSIWDTGISLLGDGQWQIWRGFALYLEGGTFFGDEVTPGVDRGSLVIFPRASAGLVIGGGQMPGETLFPVARSPSAQRRVALRFGYEQWFRTGEGLGARGVQLSVEALLAP
jgi:hypothetical protein